MELLHISLDDAAAAAGGATPKAQKKTAQIDVEHVAKLSRLTLAPEEKERMRGELEAVIGFFDELGGVNTEGVPETAHVVPLKNVFREDVVHPCAYSREELLENAPEAREGYIYVPRVVE
ncbi:Asp-tRNA(Asn)/Glu-tRNA(Gln) amidotransferase subunit GatC [Guopingia tenuis]|uniref:Asp-tRNA(Asn)/Glu-tRNA(Gln) amidotransferase subunit GatC n=1 Tax=Guopingia tenuis TaxID=2763656 RepID=UPI0038B27483